MLEMWELLLLLYFYVERQKNQSFFARGQVASVDFFIQDPTELAAFVHDWCKACKE